MFGGHVGDGQVCTTRLSLLISCDQSLHRDEQVLGRGGRMLGGGEVSKAAARKLCWKGEEGSSSWSEQPLATGTWLLGCVASKMDGHGLQGRTTSSQAFDAESRTNVSWPPGHSCLSLGPASFGPGQGGPAR